MCFSVRLWSDASCYTSNSSTSLDSTQKTTTIVTTTASGSSTSVFHGSNTTIAIVSGSNITTHGSTTATASGSNTAISPPLTATTAPGSETVTSHRSTTTTTSASSSAATLDGFADHGSSRKLSKGVAVVVALGAGKPFVSFLVHYSLPRNQVIVISLILMFAWQRRTKRRHFQKQPRGSVLFGSGPSQGTWGLASEPEKARSKAEASPGTIPTALMPACRPSISRHSDVAGSEFTKGHRSVCVDNNISWRLAVETRKHYKSASHPGSLPPPYGAPRVAPPG